jgi:hypothetical protein
MDSLGRKAGQRDRAHPAGFGDRGGEVGERDRAHPGQHDWQFDAEQFAEAGLQHVARASLS